MDNYKDFAAAERNKVETLNPREDTEIIIAL
jgi:hypothetical protein